MTGAIPAASTNMTQFSILSKDHKNLVFFKERQQWSEFQVVCKLGYHEKLRIRNPSTLLEYHGAQYEALLSG